MRKLSFLVLLFAEILMVSGCARKYEGIAPAIVPNMEEKTDKTQSNKQENMRVIGAVEPIYILPMKSPFYARIDTGAETSSLDVQNLVYFERDGEKWVSFDVVNRGSGEKHHFEKKSKKRIAVRRINEYEHRKTVEMDVKFGGETFKAQFSLADRSDFDYQALVGRNILMGRAIVDVSVSKTLR